MPYVRGVGYVKVSGKISRGTRVKNLRKPKRKTGNLLIAGPGGIAYMGPPKFQNSRNKIRTLFRI